MHPFADSVSAACSSYLEIHFSSRLQGEREVHSAWTCLVDALKKSYEDLNAENIKESAGTDDCRLLVGKALLRLWV